MRISSFALIAAVSFATFACGPRNKDRLEDNDLASAQGEKRETGAHDTRCTARTTHDEIKRQLFARAAEIRGSNGDNYQRIAGFALIQIDGAAPAVETAPGALVECRGHATVRLPSGLKVAGGRTTLGGDIGYSVGAGASGTVTLGESDTISVPLATLTQNRGTAPTRAPTSDTTQSEPVRAPAAQPPTAEVERPRPRLQPAPPPASPPEEVRNTVRPSFDCRRARTAGERAVCDSSSLASLDREMAAQYRSAAANGGPEERRLLVQTRNRFLGYRDRCGTDACVANAYRGRMREIDDIAAGRWRGGQ